jgi:hypothetical protein
MFMFSPNVSNILTRFSELGFELCGQRTPSTLIDRILIVGADPLLTLLLSAKEFHKVRCLSFLIFVNITVT